MAASRMFQQRSPVGPVVFRAVFLASLLLNLVLAYLLLRDHPEGEKSGTSNVVLKQPAPQESTSKGEEAAPQDESNQVTTGEAIGETAGKVVDEATGLRLLSLDVENSLAYTFSQALGSDAGDLVSAWFSRIFVWKLSLRSDVQKGDKIELVYRILLDTREVDIRAATFLSRKHQMTYEAYQFKPPGAAFPSYYDQNGTEVALRLVDSPIEGYEQITSLLKDRSRHNGIDFKTPVGTPVKAPFAGKVTRTNWKAPNGNCIEIVYTKNNISAKFLHLNKIMPGIVPGKAVTPGMLIAEAGNTGHSTASHLHYELASPDGRILDPLDVHGTVTTSIPAEAKADFEKARDQWRKMLSTVK